MSPAPTERPAAPAAPDAARTVLGDIAPGDLGVCDAHDHLFLRSPLLPGQELDDPAPAAAELRAFRAAGGAAVIQWTPYGMGRHAAELPRLARESGVRIVAATGLHQAAHYAPGILERLPADLAGLFVAELTEGIGGTGPRAGMIKVAGGGSTDWTGTPGAPSPRPPRRSAPPGPSSASTWSWVPVCRTSSTCSAATWRCRPAG